MNSLRWIRSGCVGWRSADGDVGLAHREIELLVGEQNVSADVGIEVDELAEARGQPVACRAHVVVTRRSPRRPLAAVGEARAGQRRASSTRHWRCGTASRPARSGSGRAHGGGTASTPRSCSSALTCRLTADWLQAERFAGMGEAAGFGRRMKNPQLVPVHRYDISPLF